MNLNKLYYFRILSECQHYTKAANKIHISQPTLSNAIKSLEDELGCALFKKAGRNAELTDYGRLFYDKVCTALNILDDAELEIKQQVNSNNNLIKIGCIPTAIGTRLPRLIKQFSDHKNSAPYFVLSDGLTKEILAKVADGTYDIGICSMDSYHSDLAFVPFYHERVVALVRPEHKLAHFEQISPAMLRPYQLISYKSGTPIRSCIFKALSAESPNLSVVGEFDSEISIAGQVSTRDVVGIVANTVYLDTFSLKKIPINIPISTRTVYICYDPQRPLSASVEAFIDFLKMSK